MPPLTRASTPAECAEWLAAQLPETYAAAAAAAVMQLELNGTDLLKLSEDELGTKLGLVKFGTKRRLSLVLKEAGAASASASSESGTRASSGKASTNVNDSPSNKDGALDQAVCEAQLQDECYALGLVKWVGSSLDKLLCARENAAWASATVRDDRIHALQSLRAECELPGVSIVVVGNTGAGKSTLLNALLDETRVLPTNGMRACTASLIEMRHEATNPETQPLYRGEVEFLSKAEWDKELPDLLDDLTPTDGPNAGRVSTSQVQPDHPCYTSWCRVYAVYGDVFKHSRVRTDERGPDGQTMYKNPTLESLKAKLTRTQNITHALGTVRSVTAKDAGSFRRQLEAFVDSKSDLVTCTRGCPPGPFGRTNCVCGSFWPIVKQVRVYSRRWAALKTGAVLVDAPGVHDDNSARDRVVKKKLKEADAVWIVSNIVRAVNDKTAKHLLGEQFRRQMLMDGQYGSLAFVATQSDVIERSEAVRSLKLPPETCVRDCAQARNAYTRRRLRQDFNAGLREMAKEAGDSSFDADAFALPVFTVSALEYQKLAGLRPHDGAARVWSDSEETQIPQLTRHVQRAALARRKVITRRRCEAMRDFATAVLRLLEQERQLPQATREAAKGVYEAQALLLSTALREATSAAENKVQVSFDTLVAPQLKAGAEAARKEALQTAHSWGTSVTVGGMHWATYKATCRRHGVFRLNMNEALVAPIFKAVSTHWEKAFISGLASTLGQLEKQVQSELAGFNDKLLTALAEKQMPASVASAFGGAQCDGLLGSLQGAVAELKEAATKQQRDLSRSMEPLVQKHMASGYDRAYAESGTGSHRRRVALLEDHISREAPNMFAAAAKAIVDKLSALRKDIGKQLEERVVRATMRTLLTTYTPLWDEMGDECLATRKGMQPKVRDLLIEANNAVRRMTAASGSRASASAAGGCSASAAGSSSASGTVAHANEDDDEVVETTEVHQAAKRQRQLEESINLCDGDHAPVQAVPAKENAAMQAPQGPIKVKSEVKVKPEVTV